MRQPTSEPDHCPTDRDSTPETPDAFDEIWRAYRPRIRDTALRFVRNESEADDVCQDVAIALIRKGDTYAGGSFVSWIHQVTCNAARMHLRREKRHRHVSINDVHEMVSSTRTSGVAPEEQVAQREELMRVWNVVADCDPITQKIVTSVAEGAKPSDVAPELSLTANAVRGRLHRVRRKLEPTR